MMFIFIFNLFNKFFIIFNLINFALIPLFFSDLFMMWFFMEINNFLFICYLCMKLINKKIIFLYYIIQVMASLMLIFSLMINNLFFNDKFFILNFIMSLMLKLGIPPFHLWMPLMSMNMPWNMLFILLTIQKITPFYMFSIIEINNLFMYFIILTSSYISVIKMINLFNFKMLLTYSSINQTSWMLMLIFMKYSLWLTYMFIYSLILLTICLIFSYFKLSSNFFFNNYSKINLNLMCLMLSLNLSSIPPFSFFFLKWLSIFIFIMNSNLYLIFILMLINSFILIYIYINLMNMTMFLFTLKSKLFYNIYYFKFNFINFSKLPLLTYFSMIMSLMILFM